MKLTNDQIAAVIQRWTFVSQQAHSHFDSILNTDDLKNLTVAQLQDLIEYSKLFIIEMEALFCDYRHLIGMVKLKVTDRSKLTSLFIDITSFRPDAKRIASCSSIMNLEFIPARSAYILKLNPEIKLVSGLRAGQQLTDVVLSKTENTLTIRQQSTSLIKVSFKVDDIPLVRSLFNTATKETQDPNSNVDKLITKLESGKAYGFDVTKENDVYTIHIVSIKDKQPIFDYFRTKVN